MKRGLEIAFKTEFGSRIDDQGDSFFHSDNLFMVVEGVGAAYLGKIAKEHVCRIISSSFFDHLSKNKSPSDAMIYSLREANKGILNERERMGEKMAASVSVAYIQDKIMYLTHLGDSRIYSYHKGELNQLTRDHTVGEEDPFLEKKYADPRLMQALTDGLGINENPSINIKKYPLNNGDIIILTTQGLTEKVTHRDLFWLSKKIGRAKKMSNGLIDLAVRKGATGNMTVGVLRYGVLTKEWRNILIMYSAFLLLILVIIGAYFLKYGGDDGASGIISDIPPAQEETEIVKEIPAIVKSITRPSDTKQGSENTSQELQNTKKKEAELFDSIHAFISNWKMAWENTAGEINDVETYILFYSEAFSSNRMDKDAWKRDKAIKGSKKQYIRVEISDIKIDGPNKEGLVDVRFSQNYRSSNYSLKSGKRLVLKKEDNDEWRIVSEKSY